MKPIFIFFAMAILAIGCRKETSPADTCIEIPPPPTGPGYKLTCGGICYGAVCINPKNADEILVFRNLVSNGKAALVKYDLKNKTNQVLFEGTIQFQPKWGKNGWILFNYDNEIWRIKSDGDSLTQLTFNTFNFSPDWNYDGSKFIYFDRKIQNSIIADFNGNHLDTTHNFGGFEIPCWQHDSLICGVGPSNTSVGNPYDNKINLIYDFEDGHSGNAAWLNNEEYIWWYKEGIYRSNYKTKETKQLKATCNAVFYLYTSYCPADDKVLFLRINRKLINKNTIENSTDIVMMNHDGSGEEVINIEE